MGGDRKEHGWLRKTVLSVARHVLIVRLGDDRIFIKDVVYCTSCGVMTIISTTNQHRYSLQELLVPSMVPTYYRARFKVNDDDHSRTRPSGRGQAGAADSMISQQDSL